MVAPYGNEKIVWTALNLKYERLAVSLPRLTFVASGFLRSRFFVCILPLCVCVFSHCQTRLINILPSCCPPVFGFLLHLNTTLVVGPNCKHWSKL